MTLVPIATGARLLGIHPKTLRHWLTAAAFPVAAHPSDARLRCVAEQHLLCHTAWSPAVGSLPSTRATARGRVYFDSRVG